MLRHSPVGWFLSQQRLEEHYFPMTCSNISSHGVLQSSPFSCILSLASKLRKLRKSPKWGTRLGSRSALPREHNRDLR